MSVIIGCLFTQHDLRLVAAALGVCLFACIVGRAMTLRARAGQDRRTGMIWLLCAGMVTGTGVWAAHFVSMLAYEAGLPMSFDTGLTALSVLIAIVAMAAAFALPFTRKGGVFGGLMVGAAVLAVHYTGMAALRLPAEAVWNSHIVLASILIGIGLGGVSGHVAALKPGPLTNFATVAARVTTIMGVHFAGVAAVRYVPTGPMDGAWDTAYSPESLSPQVMGVLVVAVCLFIIGQALVLVLVDRYLSRRAHGEEQRLRAHVAELEATQAILEKTSAELSEAVEAAEAASRAKSSFLASMSHELRTPLNAVLGFSETMEKEIHGALGAPQYKDYAQDIHRSGAHLLSLINDILDVSRLDAGHCELHEEVFGLKDEIEESMHMVSVQACKARVRLESEVAPGLPLLNGDRRRMRQILLNLLSNALKFTPPGGEVTTRAFCSADGLVLTVTDTGIGIAPEHFSKVLEPFGQVDSRLARKYQGTGLGLPLTRQLAELHGGSLTLESTVGYGTTVTLVLPAWRCVPAMAEAA
jgi:signal transduction histidine kinase